MTTPYTIESLVAELNLIASQRGWGAQLQTNISEILPDSQHVRLLHGDERDTGDLKSKIDDLESNVRTLNNDLESITSERDALQSQVEELEGKLRDIGHIALE